MKKITLLLALLFSVIFVRAQLQYSFNICGFVSSVNPNTPAINATLTGYITQNNGTTIGQFSATTDSSGNYCTSFFNAAPDSSNCAYLAITVTASIPGCNASQTYTQNEWLCTDTTIFFGISGCDTTVTGCSVFINDSTNFFGYLSAWSTGVAPFIYQWTNNNGTIYDTSQYIYPNAYGQYCATVTDANGCTASSCYYYGQNNCSLLVSLVLDSTPCMGPLHSLGVWVSGGTAPYSYLWSTGDSTEFICNLTSNTYCLTVTDAQGCTATDCYFLQSSGSCSVNIYQYTDTFTGNDYLYAYFAGGTPLSYQWQGNGSILDTTDTFYPNAPGQYCVTVADDSGCTATACYYYGPNTNQCTVYFSSYEDSSNAGLVYFYPYSSGTAPFIYSWTFSDGSTATAENPVHQFTQSNGWDYACVEITDANGCMSSYCDYVYTSGGGTNVNCQASFSGYFDDVNGTPGEIFFTDYSWGANNQVSSWNWSFGDGTGSTMQNPSHIFSGTGNYTVCLTIADNGGCTSSYCETWYVDTAWWGNSPWGNNGLTCDAQFIAFQDTTLPGMIYLVDLSYGNNLFYTWTFVSSDGTISQTISTQYPFINFNQFGCFNVCMTITDTLGNCQDSFCDSVCVDSLGNLNKATNWGLAVIPSAMPASLFLSAKSEARNIASVSAFPNPASSFVNLEVSMPGSGPVTIELVDFTGRVVNSAEVSFREGINNYRLDLNKYADGVYFVKLNSESLSHVEKVVKLR